MTRAMWATGLAIFVLGCGGSSSSDGGTGGVDASVGGTGGATGGTGGATGGAGGATGGTGGATGGTGGATGGTGGATGGTGGATGGTGGAVECDAAACGQGRICCASGCVNPANDFLNCGGCGKKCAAGEWCNGAGICETKPCTTTCSDPALCCGNKCCSAGQICCDTQGPISMGPECTAPSETGSCPMGCAPMCACAAPDTPIATPEGARPIAELRAGDRVYSVHRGALVSVPLVRVQKTPVSRHQVVRLELDTGEVVQMSARHPTADGRKFGDLRAGDRLDGVRLVGAKLVPYPHDATYDILPDSDTGAYFAAGVLVGSTLAPRPALAGAASGVRLCAGR